MKTDHPHSNSLFSEEELQKSDPLMMQAKQNEPVVCLGMTFESDEARRAYFREELRKKLPELKTIEGFPIGEDEDIINLSDPPYYTACPNPWLNDFIDEWEKEKEQLTAEGKRSDDFVVKEPYASDVSEGKNNPFYNAHSYHTKVPHPAIMRYILHYTQPGDIVFDGFAGTGMTGVAANMCGSESAVMALNEDGVTMGVRRAICSDLSAVATLISANYNIPHHYDYKRIEQKLDQVQQKYGYLYTTQHDNGNVGTINYVVWSDVIICPHCNHRMVFYDVAVDKESGKVAKTFNCSNCGAELTKRTAEKSWITYFDGTLGESILIQEKTPVLVNYTWNNRSYNKSPDVNDIALIKEAETLASSFRHTVQRMTEGSEARRNDRQGLTHVHHFYFDRTLLVLENLFMLADSIECYFLLTSQLLNISKLNRYRPTVSYPYNPLSGTLYISSLISEANPFIAYKNKIRRMIDAFEQVKSYNVTSIVSATSINLTDDSIDYIFTDPPFGSNLSYSELNFIQESWLKVCTNSNDEAIENRSLGKTKTTYQALMEKCLKEYYRILKPGKWMTVEFSNTSATIWHAIQQAIKNAGFIITNVAALDKQQGSFKAVTTTTAVKQDLVISCFKPSIHFTQQFESNKVDGIWDFVTELLLHLPIHTISDNKTTAIIERNPKILYDRLISYYVQHGYLVPLDAREFQAGLRERYKEIDGMFFTYEQAAEYLEKKKLAPEMAPLGLIVSDEANGIQWLRNELVKPQTYQDIQPKWMQAIGAVRKNDILPELKQLLEENFIAEADGKWRLPNIQDDTDLEALRTKSLLREFKIYVEAAEKPKAKIKEARVEALRAGFKQCYVDKDFETIVKVGNKIPQNLRDEDEVLLQFYDIALNKI